MTRKLYDTDSHLQHFQAQVLSCVPCGNTFRVVLDQTAFFPGGGGQACDRGRLGPSEVLSVSEEKGIIYHTLSRPVPVGRTISGSIDWAFRFDNMQQHSGEHILSGIVHAMKGCDNVGFHMNEAFTTVDFNVPFSAQELEEAERLANEVIYQNIPFRIFYPTPEELSQLTYRSKKELTGPVRLVQAGDQDLCACCAPHVALSGEIGMIKIVAAENYKGGVRLTLLCGERARRHHQEQLLLLRQIGARLSSSPEQLPEKLEKQLTEKEQLKQSLAQLSEELIQCRLRELPSDASTLVLIEPCLDETGARRLVNSLTASRPGRTAVLLPQKDGSFRYIIGSRSEDLAPLCRKWNQAFQGRGGGSSQMVQGTVWGDPKEMKRFLEE